MQTGLTLENPHLCKHGDLARRRGLRFVFQPVIDERGFPLFGPCSFQTRPGCENEKQAKERGWHKYLPSTAGRCSMRVIGSCSKDKRTDGCKTCPYFAHCHICLLSPVAPWALSYLLFLSKLLANCDICSEMKAQAKSECQYPRRGWTRWTNGSMSVKWKVTARHCVLEKWPFLIRQRGTHLSEAQQSCS